MRARFIGFTLLTLSLAPSFASAAPAIDSSTKAKIATEYFQLPLSFELNQGQTDPQVKAIARGSGYGLFLTATESVAVLSPGASDQAVLRVRTVGSNPAPRVSGVDPLPGTSNYMIGNDPSKWHNNVPTYARIKLHSVYPGIDLVYYGNQHQLEYDYVVAAGADPSSIRLAIEGASKLRIDANGDLVMETPRGAVYHRKPVMYQRIGGSTRQVAGNFVLRGNQVSLDVGAYDHRAELVIDPTLEYITYIGGSGVDQGKGLAITTTTGITLIGGSTSSTNFPTASPLYPTYNGGTDGFVAALDPSGHTLLLSSYIGGSGGDLVNSVAVDSSILPAMIYVAGTTTSHDFPVLNAAQGTYGGGGSDGFVIRFDLHIVIISLSPLKYTVTATTGFSTYLGGTGSDAITGAAMDQITKDVFITGYTTSTNFPVTSGVFQTASAGSVDAFVTRYASATGSPVFSTYMGGVGVDEPMGIAVSTNLATSSVVAVIAGVTNSSAFPGTTGTSTTGSRAFLASISGDGKTSAFSNILGNPALATAAATVATDANGRIYVAGNTNDPALPTLNPVQATYAAGGNDAYVAAYTAAGQPTFLSYWGGTGYDKATGIGVFLINNADLTITTNLFIAGYTTGNLPTVSAVQGTYGGGQADGFVAMFSSSHGGPFVTAYSTYVGGNGTDVIYGLAIGSSGNARVTGITNSTNLATTGVFQPALGGNYDAFAASILTP